MSNTSVLTDGQWAHIQPLPPSSSDRRAQCIAPWTPDSSGKAGQSFNDHRLMTEGIIYRYRAGIPWPDLPSHFGSWKTVRKQHRRNGGRPVTDDKDAYKRCNVVEHSFNTLKQWRSLARRFDKLALTYCFATVLQAVVIWSTLLGDRP